MKRLYYVLFVFIVSIILSACMPTESNTIETEPSDEVTVVTTSPTVEAITNSTEQTSDATTAPTEQEHSALYLTDVPVEDVIRYFNEVCLDAEIVNGGDPTRLQKWMSPISYVIHGKYTNEDMEVLTQFVDWLNQVEGFPGMYPAQDEQSANLNIHFCEKQEMLDIMGDDFDNMDAAVTFWYEDDIIFKEIICYRTDLWQYERNSVILEEIYNGLGPIQDSNLREDSIICSDYAFPQELTQIDALILKLLYNPAMECGMNAQQCEEVIRSLYY